MIVEIFEQMTSHVALAMEAIAVLLVAYGAMEAFLRALGPLFRRTVAFGWRKDVWVDFGSWLLLGLQFALAADIVRSAISPSWNDIGQLAAIAVIRTFLNYFLEKDIVEATEAGRRGETTDAAEAG